MSSVITTTPREDLTNSQIKKPSSDDAGPEVEKVIFLIIIILNI